MISEDVVFVNFSLICFLERSSGSRLEAVLNGWHLEVLLGLLDSAAHFKHHVVSAFWELLLGDFSVDILHLLRESVGVFVAWKIRIIQCDLPTGHHGDLHALVGQEPVEHALKC